MRRTGLTGVLLLSGVLAVGCAGSVNPVRAIAPSFSPVSHANGDIAFVRGPMFIGGSSAQIYLVGPDGANVRQATRGLHVGVGLTWSPDGKQIAFEQTGGEFGPSNIFVVGADGSGLRQLTHGSGSDHNVTPSWSPDGSRIAFAASRFEGNSSEPYAIYVMDPSGAHLTRVARCTAPQCNNDGGYTDPTWSPDGARITFGEGGDLLTTDLRTGRINTLVNCPDHVPGLCAADQPSWSPDGRWILFVEHDFVEQGRSALSIEVVEADGGGKHSLFTTTNDGADILEPSWSPDGRFVVFSLSEAGPAVGSQLGSSVIVVDADGTHRRTVVSSSGQQDQTCCPAWQPRP